MGAPTPEMTTFLCHECGRTAPVSDWTLGLWEPTTMTTTDAVELPGDIVGGADASPYERNSVLLDTSNAVLMDATDFAMMENGSDGRRFASVLIQGRVNRSKRRARVLFLMDADGLAALMTQATGLAVREGGEFELDFTQRVTERMEEMP